MGSTSTSPKRFPLPSRERRSVHFTSHWTERSTPIHKFSQAVLTRQTPISRAHRKTQSDHRPGPVSSITVATGSWTSLTFIPSASSITLLTASTKIGCPGAAASVHWATCSGLEYHYRSHQPSIHQWHGREASTRCQSARLPTSASIPTITEGGASLSL
jgi:hypothetical protein